MKNPGSNAEPGPDPLTDPIVPALQSHALVAALRLGVFEALVDGARSAREIAAATDLDEEGTARLADAMVACGYLELRDRRYALTDVARLTLLDGGPSSLANWVRFSAVQLCAAGRIERVFRTGEPVDLYQLMTTDDDRLVHQRAMAETARRAADWIAGQIPVPAGASRLLDIGGSHGVYSAAICRRNPPMRSTVYELPDIVSVARRVAAEYGTDDVCDHVGREFMDAPVAERFDVAFLGNVLHHFDTRSARGLIAKARSVLNRGGLIAIWDLQDAASHGDPTSALFSLFFHVTSRARCFPEREIRAFLDAAGFVDYRRFQPHAGATHGLYVATKADA